MSKGLGVLVLVAGVAGLGYWGAKVQAVSMEEQIGAEAVGVIAGTVHPMQVAVSGRDISVNGIADTQAESDAIVSGLDAIDGRRVVNAGEVEILPVIAPYETALAKATDGSVLATGHVPSETARAGLAETVPSLAGLPLGHGAPEGWAGAVAAGRSALAPLDEGSAALVDGTLALSGIAATPAEDEAARAALAGLQGIEPVVSIEVLDPGIVDFTLGFDAGEGFALNGIVPEALGAEGIATVLGAGELQDEVATTFAGAPGLEAALEGLGGVLGSLENATLSGSNDALSLSAEALAGLDADTLAANLGAQLGDGVALELSAATPPADGSERMNATTGRSQFAFGGIWMNAPTFEPTPASCTENALALVTERPILFVTGSANLDPASLATVNDVAGIIHLCTRDEGMRVEIGGHTDAQGDDNANYALSVARARAVRDALVAHGVEAQRLTAIGYGETEPVADNETAEGRAKNRRTSFIWP
jgi:OOP family OmpA-OmpF porin